MRLVLLHPLVSYRSCDYCKAWMHDDHGGRFGPVATRGGRPVPRPRNSPTPCGECPKIPPDAPGRSPEYAVELSGRLRDAYEFYSECRAVGAFPDDPTVRFFASVIRRVEDEAARQDARRAAVTALGEALTRHG